MLQLRPLLAGIIIGYSVVLMTEPWQAPEEDEPEKADPPPPAWPSWPRKALRAGRITHRCPKCGSNKLRYANDLAVWCLSCDTGFSPPMSYLEAMVFFTGEEK